MFGTNNFAMYRINLLITLFTVFSFVNSSYANRVNVDSLQKVCDQPGEIDIIAHQKLFDHYAKNDPDLLFVKAKELLERSIDDDNELAEMTAYFYLADYYSERGSSTLAFQNLHRAKDYYEKIDAGLELVEVYNGIGNVHYRRGEYKEAVLWYLKSMAKGKDLDNPAFENLARINLGRSYIALKDTIKGEATVLDYIDQARKLNKQKDLANGYNMIGGYYQGIGDFALADHYFNEALVISMEEGDKKSVAHCYNNLAISYFFQDKLDMSKIYFFKALKNRLEIGNKFHISESYYNIGDWFFFQDYLDSASYYYQLSYDVAKEGDSYSLMADALMAMTELEKKRGGYLKALDLYEEYVELKEKQLLNSNKEDIAELEFDRQMAESKRSKVFLNKEKLTESRLSISASRNIWLIIAAVFILCLIIILILFRLINERKKHEKELFYKEKSYEELKKNIESIESTNQKREERTKQLLIDLLPTSIDNSDDVNSIVSLGLNDLRLTRIIKLKDDLLFCWDAPLGVTESLLLRHYLIVNKDKLRAGDQIDELLSKQRVIEDFKVQWFIFDKISSRIVSKSGLQFFLDGNREEQAIDEVDDALILHNELPVEFDAHLKSLEVDLRTLSVFSVDMINKLTKDTFAKTDVLEKHVLFMVNNKKETA